MFVGERTGQEGGADDVRRGATLVRLEGAQFHPSTVAQKRDRRVWGFGSSGGSSDQPTNLQRANLQRV
jgi:hypothetical protein